MARHSIKIGKIYKYIRFLVYFSRFLLTIGQIAIDKGYLIQPIYIKGAYEIWSPYDLIPQIGLSATVEFLEPIQPVTRKQVTKDLYDILKEKENEYSC